MDKTLKAGIAPKGEIKGVAAVANGSGRPSKEMNKGVTAEGTMGRAAGIAMGGVKTAANGKGEDRQDAGSDKSYYKDSGDSGKGMIDQKRITDEDYNQEHSCGSR